MIPVCRRTLRPRFYDEADSPAIVAVWATNSKIIIGVYPRHAFFDWSATRIVSADNFSKGMELADRLEQEVILAQRPARA